MRLQFLELDPNERRLYIEQAALRRNISPVVMEKDFWVCWLLGILFESEFAASLVFKGGTSLSKVFGVIERFSEDIDLSLSPKFLGLPNAGRSRNQASKWMAKAESACGNAVQNQIKPSLEAAVGDVLGKSRQAWFEYLIDPSTRSPLLLFHYPSFQPEGFEYLTRSVKLEFGSLTDQQPIGRHPIRPWVRTHSIVLFCNSNWKKEWGGELRFEHGSDEQIIVPKIGTAVVFDTRNQLHEMLPIKHDVQRKTLALFAWKVSDDTTGHTSATFSER